MGQGIRRDLLARHQRWMVEAGLDEWNLGWTRCCSESYPGHKQVRQVLNV